MCYLCGMTPSEVSRKPEYMQPGNVENMPHF